MNDKFLRQKEVAELLGISTTTLWRWRRAGIMPQPMALSGQVIGWRTSVIEAWLEEKSREAQS